MAGKDRRKHPRVSVLLQAEDGRGGRIPYLLRDISLGGAGVQFPKHQTLSDDVAVGTAVSLEIDFDELARCALEGQVVWTLKGGAGIGNPRIGIAFTRLGDRQEAIIECMLRLNRPQRILIAFGD